MGVSGQSIVSSRDTRERRVQEIEAGGKKEEVEGGGGEGLKDTSDPSLSLEISKVYSIRRVCHYL